MTYYVWLHSSSGDVGEHEYISAETKQEAMEEFRDELHDAGFTEPMDIRARPIRARARD